MTQSQTQTAPVKLNSLAALDKKVADGLAADKIITVPQQQTQTGNQSQADIAPAAVAQADAGKAQGPMQQGDAAVTKS